MYCLGFQIYTKKIAELRAGVKYTTGFKRYVLKEFLKNKVVVAYINKMKRTFDFNLYEAFKQHRYT